MSRGPRRDVVASLLSYNSLASLEEAIAAVARQTIRPGRLIVVDNASDDGTREFLNSLDGVESILFPENVGVGAGHRAGIQRALSDPECEFIWMLEHDTLPEPDCLAEMLHSYETLIETGHRIGALHPRLERNHQEASVNTVPGGPTYARSLTFNGLLVHREIFDVVDPPRVDFFVGQEDFEFWDRLADAGLDVFNIPSALAIHPTKGNRRFGVIPGPFRSYYSIRNAAYVNLRIRRRWWTVLWGPIRAVGGTIRTLMREDQKTRRIAARWCGTFDGLAGRLGERHYWFLRRRPGITSADT